MYSRKFDETAIPGNYAGNAFDRDEPKPPPPEKEPEGEQSAPPRRDANVKGKGDGDLLIPLIALWLFDRGESGDLTPLLLLLLLWEA